MSFPSRSTDRRQALLLSILLFVLGLALFHGALDSGFTTWDDDHYVTMNPLIRDLSLGGVCRLFTGFYICNYHPLTLLSYMGEPAVACAWAGWTRRGFGSICWTGINWA